MKKRYRFVGSFMTFGDRTFSRLGQWIDLDEAHYVGFARKGEPFIPENEFAKIGFTTDELSRYADYANRSIAPDSFNAKVAKAIAVLEEIRARLSQPFEQEVGA